MNSPVGVTIFLMEVFTDEEDCKTELGPALRPGNVCLGLGSDMREETEWIQKPTISSMSTK